LHNTEFRAKRASLAIPSDFRSRFHHSDTTVPASKA
jgi:hypothetical protein